MKINLDFIYPIGALYITTSTVSPEVSFGGKWTQIVDDAYLKIVSSSPGTLGGTSAQHKIPVSSMPAHTHSMTGNNGGSGNNKYPFKIVDGPVNWDSWNATGSTGGGQPYYPYYYGVYVWKRIA